MLLDPIIFWYNKIQCCFVTEKIVFILQDKFSFDATNFHVGLHRERTVLVITKIPCRLIPGKSCFGISKFHVGLYQEE